MAVGLLGVVVRPLGADRPDVAAVDEVAMIVSEKPHAMIDDRLASGTAEEMTDREAVDRAGRVVDLPHAPVVADRLAGAVEVEEAALGIDQLPFKKREEGIGLGGEPASVRGPVLPVRAGGGKN